MACLRLSREAARAYSRGLDDQRLDVARKVEQQLGALAAKRAEHRALLGKVLAHAESLMPLPMLGLVPPARSAQHRQQSLHRRLA